jgi:hypothetical protein
MKKIYMVSCLLAMLLPFTNLMAQSNAGDCFGTPSTSPNAKIFHLKGFNGAPLVNTLFYSGFPANTTVRIYKDNNTGISPLVEGVTNSSGSFTWSYPANTPTPPVLTCVINNASCCLKNTPALTDCTVGSVVPTVPFFLDPPTNSICGILVKVNIGDKVQLLNSAGVLVPNVIERYRLTASEPGLEYVCISYPCNTIIGTVTACGATNCCSRPFAPEASLPVFLKNFSASVSQGNVSLNWSTSAEIGSKNYVIERSVDGKNFSPVGTVDAAGSSLVLQKYSFVDQNVVGAAYYRLDMIDIDAKHEYSKIVYVNTGKGTGKVTVGPTVFSDYIQLFGISSAELTRANVQVFNLTGQEVQYRVTGANAITLNESAPSGMYILKVKTQSFKILKSK